MKTIYFSTINNERLNFLKAVFDAVNHNQEANLCLKNEPDKVTRVQIQNRNIHISAMKSIEFLKLLTYLETNKELFKTQNDYQKMKDRYHTILYNGAVSIGKNKNDIIYVFKHEQDISIGSYYRNILGLKRFINDLTILKPLTIEMEKFVKSQILFAESIAAENANAHLAACFSISAKYFEQHQS